MTDGVLTIPLSGQDTLQPMRPGAAHRGTPVRAFVAGPENHLAVAAVLGLLGSHGARQPWRHELFQPLMLYGPVGSGKSHLARGLAEQWARLHPHERVVVTTAAEFATELADAIESHTVSHWRRRWRQANLLVIEQLDQIVRRQSAQSELLATLDDLLAADAAVVVTAHTPPAQLAGLFPALAARLTGGLTVPVALPSVAARRALLVHLAEGERLSLDGPTLDLLAERLPAGVLPLQAAILALQAEAAESRGGVTLEMAARYVALVTRPAVVELRQLATRVAGHFGLSLSDLKGSSRRRAVVLARDVAMLLARRLTGKSLQDVGRYFGGRDHTTVLHGCRKIEQTLTTDLALADAIEQLEAALSPRRRTSAG